jgi:hypothetical protein
MNNKGFTLAGLLLVVVAVVVLVVGWYFFALVRQWGHAESLRDEILRIVRTKGEIEANFQDQSGNTALIWAAERGR